MINNPDILKNDRPTIAVLSGSLTSEYHEGIVLGAAYVAERLNYNLIVYCGGVINSPDPLMLARDKVFELVDQNLIAGIISPSSSHTRFLDEQASAQFLGRFDQLPFINVGSDIPGYTNVLTDYESGLSEAFSHLYEHGYRKILVLRGPKHHASSTQRTEIIKKLLAKHDLEFNENRVIYSDLASITAFETYLKEVNLPFDTIIAVNDTLAVSAIDVCRKHGLRVPEDVGVIGSMNSLKGIFTTPPLSSIEEPLFELGRVATTELIAQIEGKAPAKENFYIPTSLVIRESCGCKSSSHIEIHKKGAPLLSSGFVLENDPVFEDMMDYCQRIAQQYKGGTAEAAVIDLLALYKDAIQDKKFDAFLLALQRQFEKVVKSEDITLWFSVTARLQLNTLRYLEAEQDSKALISFITRLIALKNEVESVAIKFQLYEAEYYLNYFRTVVNNLNSSFDLETVQKYTAEILNLSELSASLFDDANAETLTANNIIAVRNNKFQNVSEKNFLAKKLIPNGVDHYDQHYVLLVLPLSFRNKPIGFMTLNFSDRKGTAFENLRAVISSALKNEILIQDLKKAEERFSDIAHSTSNWLWETNVNNRFTYCSNLSQNIIGYSPEELIGVAINEHNIANSGSYIKEMSCHQDLTDVECWHRHKSGDVICLLISAKPIINDGVFSGYRGVFEDITDKKRQEEKIKSLAYSDILTGLPNRTLFQDKLAESIAFSGKNNKKFAVMFIDIDHFKHINDSMGHAAGDTLLIKLAELLSSSVRSSDVLARLGGDEFVIILADVVNESDIIDVAERIFTNLKKPIMINDKTIHSTLSLGISLYPNDGTDAQSLLQKGDNAMYQAKAKGRNGYVFYDKDLEEKNNKRNMYEEILHEAIANNGFVLHYQPQVSSKTKEILGFEALVRIQHPKLGVVPPNNFIPLAEELGLIGKIDEWVFTAGCRKLAAWKVQGVKDIRLSINLSAIQLRDSHVLETYINIMKKYHVNPLQIQIEITENALIDNEEVALNILNGFKRYGLSVALDDFGTGYSSLNCINLYPIDTIKIDRMFVKDALDNPKNQAIIKGMVLIASSLQLKIIAEGVETKEQYEFMKLLGCDEIQGYYFHKPYIECEAESLIL